MASTNKTYGSHISNREIFGPPKKGWDDVSPGIRKADIFFTKPMMRCDDDAFCFDVFF